VLLDAIEAAAVDLPGLAADAIGVRSVASRRTEGLIERDEGKRETDTRERCCHVQPADDEVQPVPGVGEDVHGLDPVDERGALREAEARRLASHPLALGRLVGPRVPRVPPVGTVVAHDPDEVLLARALPRALDDEALLL